MSYDKPVHHYASEDLNPTPLGQIPDALLLQERGTMLPPHELS